MPDALRHAGMRLTTAVTRGSSFRGRLRLAQAVNRWVMPRGGRLVSRLPDGLLMDLDLTDDLELWFHYLGDYEALERAFILSALPPDGIFLDVGANVGWHTLRAARHLTSGKVYAFEPMAASLARLRRNLELNGLLNVEVFPFALSDVEGVAAFNREPGQTGTVSMAPRPQGLAAGWLRCKRLDDLPQGMSPHRIDVVKLDVEGAELRSLRGMFRTLSRCGWPPIVCEINPTLLRLMGNSAAELVGELSNMGYRGHRLVDGPRLAPLGEWPGEEKHENVVFKHVA